jgi:hypothetical protein
VVPGPYWGGLHNSQTAQRPGTGAVLTPQDLLARTATFAPGTGTPAGRLSQPSARTATLASQPGGSSSRTASARARAAADGDFGGAGPGYATPAPGQPLRGDYLFGQQQTGSSGSGDPWALGVAPGKGPVLRGSPEQAPACRAFRAKGSADNLAMARHDKIVNSSPAKNAQSAPLRNVYSGRDAPSRLGPRRG